MLPPPATICEGLGMESEGRLGFSVGGADGDVDADADVDVDGG